MHPRIPQRVHCHSANRDVPRRRLGQFVPVCVRERRNQSPKLGIGHLEAIEGRGSAGAAGRLHHGRRNPHRIKGRQKPGRLAMQAGLDRQRPEPVHPDQMLDDVLYGPSATSTGRVPFPGGKSAEDSASRARWRTSAAEGERTTASTSMTHRDSTSGDHGSGSNLASCRAASLLPALFPRLRRRDYAGPATWSLLNAAPSPAPDWAFAGAYLWGWCGWLAHSSRCRVARVHLAHLRAAGLPGRDVVRGGGGAGDLRGRARDCGHGGLSCCRSGSRGALRRAGARVRGVRGGLGTRYGSPVRDRPEVWIPSWSSIPRPRRAWTGWCSCWTPSLPMWVSRRRD